MNLKPMRPCNHHGCRNLTRTKYCKDHEYLIDQERKERHRRYDKYQRDKEASSFYKSIEWERAREQALIRDNGLCQHCLKKKVITYAEMVDHVIPIKIAWHLRTYHQNLQSLCNKCHAIKTAEDKRKYGDRV